MKWILVVLSFLVLFSGSAVAQLTPEDLDQIRQIVDKAIDTRIKQNQVTLKTPKTPKPTPA